MHSLKIMMQGALIRVCVFYLVSFPSDCIVWARWKMGLINCLFLFVQVCQNAGTLFFSNLKFLKSSKIGFHNDLPAKWDIA